MSRTDLFKCKQRESLERNDLFCVYVKKKGNRIQRVECILPAIVSQTTTTITVIFTTENWLFYDRINDLTLNWICVWIRRYFINKYYVYYTLKSFASRHITLNTYYVLHRHSQHQLASLNVKINYFYRFMYDSMCLLVSSFSPWAQLLRWLRIEYGTKNTHNIY